MMRRWETLVALTAVVLASIGSIHAVPGHLLLTVVAVMLIASVGISQLLRAMNKGPKPSSPFDPAERAKTIREQRRKQR